MVNTAKIDDRLGDFVNRLKNAGAVGQKTVTVAHTNLLQSVAAVLEREGYLESYEKTGKGVDKSLVVTLAKPISFVNRVSKPSRRLYTKSRFAPEGRGGLGITLLSTPKGVMTSKQAKQDHVGGEVLFTIV